MASRQDYFNRVTAQARIEEAGGLARERAVLLLWYLRNEVGLDPLDAYDYITDGTNDWGVDGLYLEKEAGDSDNERLTIYQSKYLDSLRQLRKKDVEGLMGTADHFRTVTALETMLMGPIEPPLARLIKDFGLVEKVREGRLADGRLQIGLVLVATGYCAGPAQAVADAANGAAGRSDYLQVEDIDQLGPIAEAVDLRTQLNAVLEATVLGGEIMSIGKLGKRVGMAAIRAEEIIGWPGIGDRSLFDLNVRRALPRNQVRNELDAAIEKPTDHPDFLAYHNGLTVICDRYWVRDGKLKIRNPSVVNGAQSVIAFDRKSRSLTNDLRIFVKLVEVKGRPALAREVSRRSNTQNPVNPRMLMSNSGPQLRLTQEFTRSFPDIEYVTKPDQAIKPTARFINNDDAAQLLTAVFLEQPWLAVKRASLFSSDNHPAVFRRGHTAGHVVLADEIGLAVDRVREHTPPVIPDHYLGSWKLTRIVLVYLTGQVLRAGEEAGDHRLISDPSSAFESAPARELTGDAWKRLDDAAGLAAITLKQRFGSLGEADDYRKDFKNESQLLGLGSQAKTLYGIRKELPAAPTSA